MLDGVVLLGLCDGDAIVLRVVHGGCGPMLRALMLRWSAFKKESQNDNQTITYFQLLSGLCEGGTWRPTETR